MPDRCHLLVSPSACRVPTLISRLAASHVPRPDAFLLTSGHLAASPLRLSNLLLTLASVRGAAAHADAVFARLPEPAAPRPGSNGKWAPRRCGGRVC